MRLGGGEAGPLRAASQAQAQAQAQVTGAFGVDPATIWQWDRALAAEG